MDSSIVSLAAPVAAVAVALVQVLREGNTDVADARSWVVILCIGVVVALTIFFELVHEGCEHHLSAKKNYKRIFEVLMKEVTLLGFIGLCLFLSVQSGLVGAVAAAMPALEEEASHSHAHAGEHGAHKSDHHGHHEFLELFESVHMFVFFVMVFFLLLSSWLLQCAWAFERELGELAQKSGQGAHDLENSTSISRARSGLMSTQDARVLRFRAIRREFIRPSVGTPHPRIAGSRAGRFRFVVYLSICCTEDVLELIEVPPGTMVMFVALTLILRPFLVLSPPHIFYTMAAFPSACCLVLWILQVKLGQILAALTPPLERVLESTPTSQHCAPCYRQKRVVAKSQLQEWLCGTSCPDQHQALFWFWANGPAFVRHCVRLVLLCLSCYIPVLIRMLIYVDRHALGGVFLVSFFISCCAVMYALKLLPRILTSFTVATHIELMKSSEHIAQTLQIMEEGLHAQCFTLLIEMRQSDVLRSFKDDPQGSREKFASLFRSLTEAERSQADEVFTCCSSGRSDSIKEDDVIDCLTSCGLAPPSKELASIVLKGAVDPNGCVSREAYHALFRAVYDLEHKPMTFSMLQDVFKKIDTSGDGRIDAHELAAAFKALDIGEHMGLEECKAVLHEVHSVAGAPHGEHAGHKEGADADDHGDVQVSFEDVITWLRILEQRLHRTFLSR